MANEYDERDEEDDSPESAFREEELTFRGVRLEPFSFLRQTAAVTLGMRYGRLTEEEIEVRPNPAVKVRDALESEIEALKARMAGKGKRKPKPEALEVMAETLGKLEETLKPLMEEPDEVSSYDGLVMDAALVLWLCSQPDSKVRRARRKPREYEAEIDRWAEKNGISMGSETLSDATGTFGKIISRINQSEGKPKIEEGAEQGAEDEDPN